MASTQAAAFTLTPEVRRTSTVVVLGSIMSILDTTIVAASGTPVAGAMLD